MVRAVVAGAMFVTACAGAATRRDDTALMTVCFGDKPGCIPLTDCATDGTCDRQMVCVWSSAEAKRVLAAERKCDEGDLTSCEDVAATYYEGTEVDRDLGRAAALRQRACDGGRAASCVDLAMMYVNGEGVAVDPDRATALYDRACADGVASACSAASALRRLNDRG